MCWWFLDGWVGVELVACAGIVWVLSVKNGGCTDRVRGRGVWLGVRLGRGCCGWGDSCGRWGGSVSCVSVGQRLGIGRGLEERTAC